MEGPGLARPALCNLPAAYRGLYDSNAKAERTQHTDVFYRSRERMRVDQRAVIYGDVVVLQRTAAQADLYEVLLAQLAELIV